MSRRSMLYRKAVGKSPTETRSNLLAGHGMAHGKGGEVCSRPMTAEKADRLTRALHK